MFRPVFLDGGFKERECVKDCYGQWICEGMFVTAALGYRQGWITEVIDKNDGFGEIKVRLVGYVSSDDYVTDFDLGTNWCKA